MILAQQFYAGWGIGQWVLAAILIIGVLSILVAFINARGWQIPQEFKIYAWIVLGVVVAAIAVKIILSLF